MATTPRGRASGASNLRFPTTLDLKDIITIVSVAVSLTLGWGVFTTRMALVENELVTAKQLNQQQDADIDKLQARLRRLENHQQDDELIFDQVYMLLRKPPPTRRAE